ncbi:MAG: tetratricopeptide repeat protein [Cyanobacteria bacterium]|nr:tetratricopeptide repeat protein [Cyanobacteriota bacterium]
MKYFNAAGEMIDRADLCKDQGDYLGAQLFIERAIMLSDSGDAATARFLTGRLVEHHCCMGNYEKAEQAWQTLLSQQRKDPACDDREIASTLAEMGVFYRDQGKWRQSSLRFNQALKIQECEFGKNYPDYAVTLSEKAYLCSLTNRKAEAQHLLDEALDLAEHEVGKWEECVALVLRRKAKSLSWIRPEILEPYLERAIAILSEESFSPHPELRLCLSELADLTLRRGLTRKAERLYLRSLQLTEPVMGSRHSESIQLIEKLANVRRTLRKFEEAKVLYKKLLEIRQQSKLSSNQEIAAALLHLGSLLRESQEFEEAEPILTRALKLQENSLGEAHEAVASTLYELGSLHHSIGDLSGAECELQRALTIWQGSDHRAPLAVADTLSSLALVHLTKRQLSAAEQLLEEALALKEEVLGRADPKLVEILTRLGTVCDGQSKTDKARKYYQRASNIETLSTPTNTGKKRSRD